MKFIRGQSLFLKIEPLKKKKKKRHRKLLFHNFRFWYTYLPNGSDRRFSPFWEFILHFLLEKKKNLISSYHFSKEVSFYSGPFFRRIKMLSWSSFYRKKKKFAQGCTARKIGELLWKKLLTVTGTIVDYILYPYLSLQLIIFSIVILWKIKKTSTSWLDINKVLTYLKKIYLLNFELYFVIRVFKIN